MTLMVWEVGPLLCVTIFQTVRVRSSLMLDSPVVTVNSCRLGFSQPEQKSSLRLCISWAAIAWVLLGSACSRESLVAVDESPASAGLTPGQIQDADGTTNSCAMNSTSCKKNSDCCSQNCTDAGTCQAPPMCGASGTTCNTGSDRCSSVCGSDDLCPVIPGCAIVGEPCTSSSDCCSGACSDPGTGVLTCQAIDGCLPLGEICSSGLDCCSSTCQLDPTSGVSRCLASGDCSAVGEICTIPPTSTTCCGERPGQGAGGNPGIGLGGCQMTKAGVPRCTTPAPSGQCNLDLSVCQINEQCCGGFCLPSASGSLTCMNSCAASGAQCRASRDCCDSASCVSGYCRMTGINCQQLGTDCSTGALCCGANCDTTTETCVPPSG